MPLYLDKILTQFAAPLGSALFLALVGVLLLSLRRRRLGFAGVLLALGWLWFWSLPVVADCLSLSLEGRFIQQTASTLPNVEAVVVLGGGISAPSLNEPYPNLEAGADRVWHAARIYKAGKAPLIIASGGKVEWQGKQTSEAEAMRYFLLDLGVPAPAILLEEHSRNTHENALFTARLMQEHGLSRIILVTSAMHMPRALASFKAAGLSPIPAPTDFKVSPEPSHLLRWLPDAQSLSDSTDVLREYLGLLIYRLRRWA